MRMPAVLRNLIDALAEMLFPRGAVCVCCGDLRGQAEGIFCPDCAAKYKPRYDSIQLNNFRGVERLYSATRYSSPASDAVKAFKFHHNGEAGRFMAAEMVRAAEQLGLPAPDAVVPVPLHWIRQYTRGFNQSETLAKALAKELGAPMRLFLRRKKYTRMQSTLPAEKRSSNIQNAFAAKGSCEGMSILLVDDVCTTGATGHACAAALRSAGAAQVELFVFADATRRKKPVTGRREESTDEAWDLFDA